MILFEDYVLHGVPSEARYRQCLVCCSLGLFFAEEFICLSERELELWRSEQIAVESTSDGNGCN